MNAYGNSQSWLDFAARLSSRHVRFAIIGGHAVNFHGYLRATEDVDIVFRRDAASEENLLRTLEEFEAFWIGDDIDPATGLEHTYPITMDHLRSHPLLMLGTTFGYVDLFDFLPGLPDVSFDDFLKEVVTSNGLPFASLEWLKRLKQVSNRPQDQIDLQRLP